MLRLTTLIVLAFTLALMQVHAAGSALAAKHRHSSKSSKAVGERAARYARHLLGVRYEWGGTSPRTGFDCSGYTMWVYEHAHVASLPHYTESQRHARHMRKISAQHARPGDLVFYLSGGSSYHVAIYAGRGMQYAAATPRDGIRYQAVWSRAVEYRTDWH